MTKPPPSSAAAEQALQRFEDARQNPFDEAKRQAYLAQLPRVGNYFILEGDLKMTEQEVIAHLISGQKETIVDLRPELS
jgi:hypothetical protein